MRLAYADPPYLGCGKRYAEHHPNALDWDDPERHRELIRTLSEFDSWAMSCSSTSLYTLLPMCPADARIAAWTKPFAVFKPHVNPAYTWEPVIFFGGRKGDRSRATVKDHLSHSITLKKGLVGAKPPAFALWIFDLLGAEYGDEFHDLFPGTGVFGLMWQQRFAAVGPRQTSLIPEVTR